MSQEETIVQRFWITEYQTLRQSYWQTSMILRIVWGLVVLLGLIMVTNVLAPWDVRLIFSSIGCEIGLADLVLILYLHQQALLEKLRDIRTRFNITL